MAQIQPVQNRWNMLLGLGAGAMGLASNLANYIGQYPTLVEPVAEVVGGVGEAVGGVLGLGQEARARKEREQRLEKEAEKTKELLREESKIASEERKEVYGLESAKTQEMLDKELKYLSTLADKNIELFNRYFENLATKRQELIARGVRPEEIGDFFQTLLSARQNIMAQATSPANYQVPVQTGLAEARIQRLGQIGSAFTPLQQPESLPRMQSLSPALRTLATAYIQANKKGGMFPIAQPKAPIVSKVAPRHAIPVPKVKIAPKPPRGGTGEKKDIIKKILAIDPNANVSGSKAELKKKLKSLNKGGYGGRPSQAQLATFKEGMKNIPLVPAKNK